MAGVIIGGMGYDPGNYKWVSPFSPFEGGHWEYTNTNYQVGAMGGGRRLHAGISLDAHDFFRNSHGSEADWQMMTAAGYQYDPSKASSGGWMYKGPPSCSFETLNPKAPGETDHERAMNTFKMMAACQSKGKNGGKKGKCCCCCCCEKQKNGTTPTLTQNIVLSGDALQHERDRHGHYMNKFRFS